MEYSLADSSRRKDCMPVEPLPDDIVARLRSDRTAALAAAVIVAGAFPGIVSWAARVFCVSSNAGGNPAARGLLSLARPKITARADQVPGHDPHRHHRCRL